MISRTVGSSSSKSKNQVFKFICCKNPELITKAIYRNLDKIRNLHINRQTQTSKHFISSNHLAHPSLKLFKLKLENLLNFVDLAFPENHIDNSIFNKNKIKLSYGYLPNINQLHAK